MKKKEKIKALERVVNECGNANEAMFAIYSTKDGGEYFGSGNMEHVRSGIKTILEKGIAGKEQEGSTRISWAIIGAIHDLQKEGVFDINELMTAFDDEEDGDEELCPDCKLFDKCKDKKADAWRTILGIDNE